MKNILILLLDQAPVRIAQIAWCGMRIGLGVLSICHGFPKLEGGAPAWINLGAAASYIGLTKLPALWGLLAASAEFFGGIALVLGFCTRIASFFLFCTMIFALLFHLNNGDSFAMYSFPLTLIVVFLSIAVIGGGSLSLDGFLTSRLQSNRAIAGKK